MSLGEFLGSGTGTTKALYHLNGSSVDSSGNGNNGTDTSISYVDGKFGKCASFNGTSSKILPGAVTGLGQSDTSPFTIGFWIKLGSTASTMAIMERFQGPAPVGNWSWFIRCNAVNAGDVGCYFNVSQVNEFPATTAGSVLNTTEFKNVFVTYDGTYGNIYVNGELLATSTKNCNQTNNSVKNISIGYRAENNSSYLNGSLDEIIGENRAWSASEIKKYYAFTKGRFGV